MLFTESTYEGTTRNVKYVFEEAKVNSEQLLIVFSGFASIKATPPYRYNYIRTLRQVDINKLFILDEDGPRGSYYLGKEMSFDFETSIMELIQDKMEKLNIDKENVFTAGTSKGGSAALYYALKYKMGRAIVGAPQTKIANYILHFSKETAEHILGDLNDKSAVDELNRLVVDQLKDNEKTHLTIQGSVHDNQHPHHIEPFVEVLEKKKHPYTLVLDDRIKGHADVAKFYPDFIVNKLLDILHGFTVSPLTYTYDDEGFQIDTDTTPPAEYIPVIRFLEGDTVLQEMDYEAGRKKFTLDLDKPTTVNVSYTILKNGHAIFRKDLAEHLISDTNIICEPTIQPGNKGNIHFNLNLDTNEKLKYAFYVYHNGKVIMKNKYKRKQKITYRAKEKGNYLIKYFIRLPDGEKIIGKSDEIQI